jgi:hypothetical protein
MNKSKIENATIVLTEDIYDKEVYGYSVVSGYRYIIIGERKINKIVDFEEKILDQYICLCPVDEDGELIYILKPYIHISQNGK